MGLAPAVITQLSGSLGSQGCGPRVSLQNKAFVLFLNQKYAKKGTLFLQRGETSASHSRLGCFIPAWETSWATEAGDQQTEHDHQTGDLALSLLCHQTLQELQPCSGLPVYLVLSSSLIVRTGCSLNVLQTTQFEGLCRLFKPAESPEILTKCLLRARHCAMRSAEHIFL